MRQLEPKTPWAVIPVAGYERQELVPKQIEIPFPLVSRLIHVQVSAVCIMPQRKIAPR
jgi:hypothetical protein